MSHWRWQVTARYTEDEEVLRRTPPGRRGAAPGGLAFVTVHETEPGADFETAVARQRPEIGEVIKSQVLEALRS